MFVYNEFTVFFLFSLKWFLPQVIASHWIELQIYFKTLYIGISQAVCKVYQILKVDQTLRWLLAKEKNSAISILKRTVIGK